MAAKIEEFETREHHQWDAQAANIENGSDRGSEHSDDEDKDKDKELEVGETTAPEDDLGSDESKEDGDTYAEKEKQKLMRMSINTAVAIGLHNLPEGLATFVASLNDPRIGGVLAIAIAIHNIPEGLCVAMPIYYATGNRWKAFGWAVLSGASEPLAALLGWAVLANSFSDDMYAILFGIVAGMMVIISVRELLPTAHRYDPEDTVVTYSFMVGMAIMAVSLVLFTL
jgi:ZIP family zinc transporter